MPTITLTDNSSLSVDASVADDSVIGRTPLSALHFLSSDVIGALNQRLDAVQIASLSIGFDCKPSFPISGGSAKFTAGGGITGELHLFQPGGDGESNPLFPRDQYGTDIEMGRDYYLALSFQLALSAGADVDAGAFTIHPTASATSAAKLYLPFAPTSGAAPAIYPTLKSALETLISKFKLPSSLGDWRDLPIGTVFAYDAQGSVRFDGQLDVLAAINPTASLSKSLDYGPISINAGPSVTLCGGFKLSGDFQVRMWNKDDNVIQLGYYKKRDQTFTVSFDASASVDASLQDYDAIAKLYSLLGSAGQLDPGWLKANIPASVADKVEDAYENAVQTKLSIAIDEECDTTITDQVAFSWNFDRRTVGPEGLSLFTKAINGDLSGLLFGALPSGVSKAGSVFDNLKKTKHTFTFNFLGLFNYSSVQDACLQMVVKASDDGQVVITDSATLSRLDATATPLVSSDRLRQVLVEDFVATMGYLSSSGKLTSNLKLDYSYYRYKSRANVSDLGAFVGTATVLLNGSKKPQQDWASVLRLKQSSQSSSLLATLTYDNPTAVRLFLDENSQPRAIPDLQLVGRQALLNTPGLGLNTKFVAFLQDAAQWQKLLTAGSMGGFYDILGINSATPPTWAQPAFLWTRHIIDWSSVMHSAGQSLQSVLQYLDKNPGTNLLADAQFKSLRNSFASQLKAVVQKTPLFNDSMGIITIALAAPPSARSVSISFAGQTRSYS